MTALHWAAQHGHREVAELLLKYGADVHSLSKFDKTPFDIAMDTSNTELMILLQVKGGGLCVVAPNVTDVFLLCSACKWQTDPLLPRFRLCCYGFSDSNILSYRNTHDPILSAINPHLEKRNALCNILRP